MQYNTGPMTSRWAGHLFPRVLLYAALALGLLGLLSVAAVRAGMIERYFIYFPVKGLDADPSQVGLEYEDVTFLARDGVELHGWFTPGERSGTLVWFHGNAGNISHRLDNLKLLHDALGYSILLFDYRGYGRSQGRPSELGTYLDAEATLAYLATRGDVVMEETVYFGRSLGAAVAVEMATRHRPAGLILESAFPSIPYMARRAYPLLPIWPLLRTRYDSQAKIADVKSPLLMLHGDRDDIVPIDAGRRLFDAATGPKEFYTIRGAGHNDTYQVGGQAYFDALRSFVDRAPRTAGP